MITVKPYGGLGNRIRVLYSVLALNEHLKDQIKIYWECSSELNCPFEKLFICPEKCQVVNIQQGLKRSIKRYGLNRLHFAKLRSLKYDVVIYDDDVNRLKEDNNLVVEQWKDKSVYIETCYSFFSPQPGLNLLEPTKSIRQNAEEIYSTFSANTYGIHIRTKIPVSNRVSPPDAFRQLIKNRIETDETVQFFLTTDSRDIEKDFADEFQDKIITTGEKKLDRNSAEGIESALVDMLCLSKTKKIYGSYWSSFSSVPGLFTGVKCESVVVETE